jgi:L-amino acid N-acyltransferase YncA
MGIRIATEQDLPAINGIYNQAVEERSATAHLHPVSLEDRQKWFADHDPRYFPVFVLEKGKVIQGWISLGAYRKGRQALAHVAEVSYYADRGERGKGVGSALLGHAIRIAPEFGFSVLIAILLDRNPASIALLEKYGFARWGRMPGIALMDGEEADHLYYGLKL